MWYGRNIWQPFWRRKIKNINFKEKSIGWDTFTFRVDTDKRIFKERGMHNLYLRSMFLSWNMRPSCFQCPFKNAKRISDFTLADAWGYIIVHLTLMIIKACLLL